MSFHNDLNKWLQWCDPELCPVCRDEDPPGDIVTLRETAFSWFEAHPNVCLPGTCYVLAKTHAVELDDLSESDLLGFMKDVQVAAKALKHVTGAVKINYEIHGNTVPHLHMHLFPRTVNDPFPGAPIDYRQTKPTVYPGASFDEFIASMKECLAELAK